MAGRSQSYVEVGDGRTALRMYLVPLSCALDNRLSGTFYVYVTTIKINRPMERGPHVLLCQPGRLCSMAGATGLKPRDSQRGAAQAHPVCWRHSVPGCRTGGLFLLPLGRACAQLLQATLRPTWWPLCLQVSTTHPVLTFPPAAARETVLSKACVVRPGHGSCHQWPVSWGQPCRQDPRSRGRHPGGLPHKPPC